MTLYMAGVLGFVVGLICGIVIVTVVVMAGGNE